MHEQYAFDFWKRQKASHCGCSVASSNLGNSFSSGQRAHSASHSLIRPCIGCSVAYSMLSAHPALFVEYRLQCLLHSHHFEGKKGCIQKFNYILEISAQSIDAVFRMCRCGTRGSTRPMLSISQFQGPLPGTLQPLTNCDSSHCKIPTWPVTRCPSSSSRSTSWNPSRSALGSACMLWSTCGSFSGTSTKH
jgi:hypothetical protein